MLQLVVWALGTGLVTGGVWVAIVLKQQQQRLIDVHDEMIGRMEDRLTQLEAVHHRLGDVEARLDFTERILQAERDSERLSPGS
ncbi:MAG: hypothetical protein ABJC19_08745 [Gemmatimonadota bacterium]